VQFLKFPLNAPVNAPGLLSPVARSRLESASERHRSFAKCAEASSLSVAGRRRRPQPQLADTKCGSTPSWLRGTHRGSCRRSAKRDGLVAVDCYDWSI